MTRPTMNGKVPDSTPAADQPIPLSRLETTTAAPNAPVMSAAPLPDCVQRPSSRL